MYEGCMISIKNSVLLQMHISSDMGLPDDVTIPSQHSYSDNNLVQRDVTDVTAQQAVPRSHQQLRRTTPLRSNASFSEFTSTTERDVTADQSQQSNQFQFAKIDGSTISINMPSSSAAAAAGTGTSTGSTPTLGRRVASSQSITSSEGYNSLSTSPRRDGGKKPVDLKKTFNSGLSSLSKGFGSFSSKFDRVKQSVGPRRDEQGASLCSYTCSLKTLCVCVNNYLHVHV